MSTWSLRGDVERILQILSSLPGSKELEVKTKRYPRFLPADTGKGYEERSWHWSARDIASPVPIPADSEDVLVTWCGEAEIPESASEFGKTVGAALRELDQPHAWDFEVHTVARKTDAFRLEVRVFRKF